MVAPTPFFDVGVDFGQLITKIEADLVPIAKTTDVTLAVAPLAKTSDVTSAVAPLAKTSDVTTAVAPLAKTTDVTAAVAPLAKTTDVTVAVAPLAKTTDVTAAVVPLAKTTDVTAAVAPLAKTTDVTTAVAPLSETAQEITEAIGERTNEETIFGQISSLKCLIIKHWFVEQAIEYVLNQQVKGGFGFLSHRLELHESAGRANLTVEKIRREAASLHMADFLPDDPDCMEELLGTLKAIIENLPSQTHPPRGGSSTRR
jgi:hypothetical protein